VKRLKMLLGMLALAAVIAAVVYWASPYAPVIEPAGDIEALWAIEDTREESWDPLVTRLENNGVPMGYDAALNTFYCPLGMGNADAWPEIHLTAPDAQGVRMIFSDDYTYDWCADAIRDAYSYEVMAYTDTQYAYFYIVFTALPQVMITSSQEITTEDSPIGIEMAAYGEEALRTTGRIHLRGASTLLFDKRGYKMEFTRERNGSAKKIELNAPGFGMADDIALLPCWHDDSKIRDKLNWDLHAEIYEDGESFGARIAEYVEVFLNDEYVGLYLMIEPVDVQEEIARSGEDRLMTDSVYRTAALNFSRDREYLMHPKRANAGYELYYAPQGAQKFAGMDAYIDLMKEEDDEEFARKALACMDMDSLINHLLFVQGAGISDNFFNNMYIWSHPTQDGVTYRFSCWDLDMAWGFEKDEIGEEFENWLYFPIADRMINLDVGGIRQKLYDRWQELRATIFSEERLEERITRYQELIGDSGALMRDAEKWQTGVGYPDGYDIVTFSGLRWPILDRAIELIATNGGAPVEFLTSSHYKGMKGSTMRIALGEQTEE